MAGTEDNWRTQTFRQSVVSKIEEVIQQSGMQVARNSSEMENHVFMKAKTREEYMNMVAKLILHVREMCKPQSKQNQGGPSMQRPQGQGPPTPQNQQGQAPGPNGQNNLAPDPINALQNLASQGSRNQMMNMGPQGQMQQQVMGGNPGMGMQQQMGQQGPISSQGPQVQPATNLLQTLNQRPQMQREIQKLKLKPKLSDFIRTPKYLAYVSESDASGRKMVEARLAKKAHSVKVRQLKAQEKCNALEKRRLELDERKVAVLEKICNDLSELKQMFTSRLAVGPIGTQDGADLQKQLGGPMGMNQGQMGGNMGGMGGMGNMGSQLQSQLAGPSMQGQMMSMPNSMQTMGGNNSMGQMPCNQMGQMPPGSMQGQMGGQMGMSSNQMVGMNMVHMGGRVGGVKAESMGGMMYGSRAPPPAQFLRQSPSPSAPSPGCQGPSPQPMGVMGGPMPSPMGGLGALGACGGVGSPSPSAPHLPHHAPHAPHVPPQRNVGMGMVASPSSSLNTPLGGGVASPGGEEAAYREKVRQLSKYIEPLRRMVMRMVSEGENVEKLTKMKNLLDILSNPNKRMPLETLIKCEVVLEKLDFKRSEGLVVGLPTTGKEQIFNPLLEVVNNCLQSPLANHTLKRTFGSTLDSLNGPEIKNLPPPLKISKLEEPEMEIPDVLQGEIARLDSRFKVSLEPMQLSGGGGGGGISLVATLDDARLPCVPSVVVVVPRAYPAAPPARARPRHPPASPFLHTVLQAMDARCARLPKSCSVGQLLDAWEMSVRQASAPSPAPYTPVPALGL